MDVDGRAPIARPPASGTDVARNPVATRKDWEAARAECLADPGAYHGRMAARMLHWFVGEADAWLSADADGHWSGWNAATGEAIAPDLPADFAPWTRAFDASDPPNWRWFEGGRTNACFNEVDRHVLAGFGEEAALIFEGDRWDMAAEGGRGAPVDSFPVSRRRLLFETVKCAVALRALGLKAGDRIALNMPSIVPQIYWTEAAKRLGIVYTAVFGGFSDKTLSDRIADAGARVIVTSDGSYRNAQVAAFKTAYTDPALDNYVSVGAALDAIAAVELGLADEDAATLARIVAETLAGEGTVERSDVMRGVGRALVELGRTGRVTPNETARIRVAIASALVTLTPRVDAVIVVRHTGQPDLVWRDERDRWAHELTDAALMHDPCRARARRASRWRARPICSRSPIRTSCARFGPPARRCRSRPIIRCSSSTRADRRASPRASSTSMAVTRRGSRRRWRRRSARCPGDVIYVVADPGWITGQSYLISAALTTRVTSLITEGSPVFPHAGRFAASIERHGVTIFKAGVTFLKSVMSDPANLHDLQRYDMSGLRVATFCAEPVSPPVQAFGMAHVTPDYINSYWATEHGGIAWTRPYGNADFPLKADTHAWPLPWIVGDVWVEDADGGAHRGAVRARRRGRGGVATRRRTARSGEIVIAAPYPYLARTIWGDAANFRVKDGAVLGGWRGGRGALRGTDIGGAGAGRGRIRRAISRYGTRMARSASTGAATM